MFNNENLYILKGKKDIGILDIENLYILQFPGHAITLSQQVLGSALIVRLYLTVS